MWGGAASTAPTHLSKLSDRDLTLRRAPTGARLSDASEVMPPPPTMRRQLSDVSRAQSQDSAGPPTLRRQLSDSSRDGDHGGNDLLNAATVSRVCSGQLVPSGAMRIVFLDIDGVLAPRVNAGQIVKQCVDGVVALCRAADARVVISSSWRLIEGKVAEFEQLLTSHHGVDSAHGLVYDVTPDLRGQDAVEDDSNQQASRTALHVAPFKDRFVRVHERRGLSLDDVRRAARLLGAPDRDVATLDGAFVDPDYDLHVYSEVSREYSRTSFSPRSRKGEDWTHEACSADFARTRRREVVRWLEAAAAAGLEVESYVVLDDDDLLLTGDPPPNPVLRTMSVAAAASSSGSSTRGVPAAATDEEDDAWAFAF